MVLNKKHVSVIMSNNQSNNKIEVKIIRIPPGPQELPQPPAKWLKYNK